MGGFYTWEGVADQFAFGTMSLVTARKMNQRGQEQDLEDHLEGCYHNPGQK